MAEGTPLTRVAVDAEGVTWAVTEAYRFTSAVHSAGDAPRTMTLAVVWFETASGRTASIHLPAGCLKLLSDEELLEFLRIAMERRGRQP